MGSLEEISTRRCAAMKRWLAGILAVGVGAVFVAAGAGKVADPAQFALDVFNYRLLPWPGAVAVALYLPWLEIIVGIALMSRARVVGRGALLLCTAMTVVFLVALVTAGVRGLDIRCGCFGGGGGSLGEALVRDVALLGGCVVLWVSLVRDAGERGAARR
jgi:putative oxidoreductase